MQHCLAITSVTRISLMLWSENIVEFDNFEGKRSGNYLEDGAV
jgi:hypothetical protein